MTAMAADKAEAALRELCSVLLQSGVAPVLSARQFLDKVDLEDELLLLDESMVKEVENAAAMADGDAGDQKKYKAVAEQMQRRWQVFLGKALRPT